MATPVATGEVVQVLVQGVIEQQECQNVWYFRAQAADADMLAHLLMEVAACVLAALPSLSSTYRLVRIKGKVVSPAVGLEEEWTPDVDDAVQGAAAGDGRSSHESAVISLQTTRPGRSGKGRIYVAGVPEGATTGSLINDPSPYLAALQAFVACMLAKWAIKDVYAAGDYTWGVMSRKLGGLKPPFLPAGYAPIIRAKVNRELGTTRSRKIRRGA
jgi:hypothetical protein